MLLYAFYVIISIIYCVYISLFICKQTYNKKLKKVFNFIFRAEYLNSVYCIYYPVYAIYVYTLNLKVIE